MIVATRPLCLSPRRKAVLVALHTLARPTPWGLGYAPTLEEVRRETGISSTSVVLAHLQALWGDDLVTHEWDAYVSGTRASRAWRLNYGRVLYVTQDGVTDVREIETVGESVCREP